MSTIFADGATQTVYLKQELGSVYSSTDKVNWSQQSFPITINNSNGNPSANILKILFTTNLQIDNNSNYFSCGSDGLQFGSRSLNSDGSKITISIAVDYYDGLIQNGDELTPGCAYISVYNLLVDGSGHSLQIGAGWLGKKWFGNGKSNNFIVNCSSNGDIPSGGAGGLLGAFAGKGSDAQLFLRGCSSNGTIGQSGGGIVGAFAGQNGGSVTCEQCWSEGMVEGYPGFGSVTGGGGIFGESAGKTGTAVAKKCYSTGAIGNSCGGIFGAYAGDSGSAVAEKCYSSGFIDTDGGGIFARNAAPNSGSASATNCYSSGSFTTSSTGIFGTNPGTYSSTNRCYSANGNWNGVLAMANLTGTPSGTVGTTWVSPGINQPYELADFGYTPYSLENINSSSDLIQTYDQTIEVGQTTQAAINPDASGNAFSLLQVSGDNTDSYGTITMNQQTGALSTTNKTAVGVYRIVLRSVGSYTISQFVLTVVGIPTPQVPCCIKPVDMKRIDNSMRNNLLAGTAILGNSAPRRGPISYTEIMMRKMAANAKY